MKRRNVQNSLLLLAIKLVVALLLLAVMLTVALPLAFSFTQDSPTYRKFATQNQQIDSGSCEMTDRR